MSLSSLERAGAGRLPGEYQAMKGMISFLGRSLSAAGSGMSAVGNRLKVARMALVLGNLSDQQLAEIGITRGDIMRHAEHLIAHEYGGL